MGKKRKEPIGEGENQQAKGNYFTWTEALDAILIQCMMALVDKHQVENGAFKNGAFSELETMMNRELPGCGVKADPNIRSRHKKLKKDFQAVHLMRMQSGFGWDEKTLSPMVDDDVFEHFLKVHPNCKNLNKKPFPFYYDLLTVFGKGGPPNGKGVVGVTEDVVHSPRVDYIVDLENEEECTNPEVQFRDKFMEDNNIELVDLSPKKLSPPRAREEPSKEEASYLKRCGGTVSSAKKKSKTDDAVTTITSEICKLSPIMSKALEALGTIMAEPEEDTSKQSELVAEIAKIDGLTRSEVIDAAMALVDNDRKTRLLYALNTVEDRYYFIRNLLKS